MIGYVSLKDSIIAVLKANASEVTVIANEELSGFKPPAFFVQIVPTSNTPSIDYEEQVLMVNVHYFPAEKTDLANLKMFDQLNMAFFNVLNVGERALTIQSKNPQILDNVLQFKFSLEFTNDVDAVEINGEWVVGGRLDATLGYTEDTVELMQDLEIEED